MAKRFGLQEFERATEEVGTDPVSVKAMHVAVVVMGGRWTVPQETRAERERREAEAQRLREEAARAQAQADARAAELRKQAEQAEREGQYQANLLSGEANSNAYRAGVLAGYERVLSS